MFIPSSITLAGAPNFRDMGGYVTQDGRIVKRGLLFRSGESSQLTDADLGKLKTLDAKLIVDLRSEREVAGAVIRWPIGKNTEFIAANILADMQSGNKSLVELLITNPNPRGASEMMETTYSVLPHALGPTLLKIARHIVDEDRLPLIFHCTVGRDRAGMIAAMLLHALGVPRDALMADYLRTNVHIDAARIRQMSLDYLLAKGTKLDTETLDILTFARIEHFHAAFRTIAVEYGEADNLDSIGIDAGVRKQLCERLLEIVA